MATEKNISGIAMNERLNDASLLDDFYQAANKKDRNTMIDLLVSIEIERSQAEETADAILNNRAFDGS